jgi:hypothetical protein
MRNLLSVGVAVDEARQHGVAGQVELAGARREGFADAEDRGDPLAVDQQDLAVPDLARPDVDQPSRPDRQALAALPHPALPLRPPSAPS